MFRGSIVALVTPFKEDLEIDFEAYGGLVDFQLEHGTHGFWKAAQRGRRARDAAFA